MRAIGRKTIKSLCKENEVNDVFELCNLFLYWLECGQRQQVASDLESLRKSERREVLNFARTEDSIYRELINILIEVL